MKLIVLGIFGALASLFGLAALLGWLVAVVWNHFPFLETVHHMSLWDGFLLHLLGSMLFKSAVKSN